MTAYLLLYFHAKSQKTSKQVQLALGQLHQTRNLCLTSTLSERMGLPHNENRSLKATSSIVKMTFSGVRTLMFQSRPFSALAHELCLGW